MYIGFVLDLATQKGRGKEIESLTLIFIASLFKAFNLTLLKKNMVYYKAAARSERDKGEKRKSVHFSLSTHLLTHEHTADHTP